MVITTYTSSFRLPSNNRWQKLPLHLNSHSRTTKSIINKRWKRELLKYFKCHIFHHKFTVILLQLCFSNNKPKIHVPRRNLYENVTVPSYRYWFPTSIILLVTKFDKLSCCPETVVFNWQIKFFIRENIFSKITLFQKSDNRKRVDCRTHSFLLMSHTVQVN